MLESSNRREQIGQLTDPAFALKAQVDLWNRSDRWVIYYRDGYCQKIVAKNAADANKIYNGVSKDYAKILWNNGKVIHKYGGGEWTLNCIQDAERSSDIAQLQHDQENDSDYQKSNDQNAKYMKGAISHNSNGIANNSKENATLRAEFTSS